MTKTKQHARFPKQYVEDGTLRDMTRTELQIYLVLASHFNVETHNSGITYEHIRSHIKETNGVRILSAIERLMELGPIRSYTEPYIKRDGSESEVWTRRKYHIRIGNEHK